MTANKNKNQVTIGFIALGCPKNLVDSERMLAQIAQAGFIITDDADNADAVVINTCGFIAPAKIEAYDAIHRAVVQKRKGNVKKIIVAGCLPQRAGKELLNEVGEIDAVLGLEHSDDIVPVLEKCLAADKHIELITPGFNSLFDDRIRLRITPQHYAYLKICEGCSRNCSFCTIPAIRGKARSKSEQLILDEALRLVHSGTVELNIIGQDITTYGNDLKIKDALPSLLVELSKIPRLRWIRLLYLYPTGVTDRLIETVSDCEKILPYFDIPLQHINPQILKAMRRPHSKDKIVRLIEKLRRKLPHCVLRTTFIVGFPGETDRHFDELLNFIEWARFDNLGCFTFYPEERTPAAKLPQQIPDRVKQQRLDRLMLAQQKIAFEKNKARIGQTLTCLIDKIEKGHTATGRFFGQAPQIDPVCIINNSSADAGDFIKAKVASTRDYDLLCRRI